MAIFSSSHQVLFSHFTPAAAVTVLWALLVAGSSAQTNYMLSGDILQAGQNLSTVDYSLVMQPDCNLVLYRNAIESVWSTNTYKKGVGCELRLKTDGNLVIYDEEEKLVWETKTNGTVGHYVLLLQRDRNVALYSDTQWNSGTASLTK